MYKHAYIHSWSIQLFSRDYDIAFHTTYAVCVNFINEWQDVQFKVDSKRQTFDKLFNEILSTLRVSARNLLRGIHRRNIFSYFIFMSDLRFEPWPQV